MRRLLSLVGFVWLASCASLSEEACREGNWIQIGFTDGAAGRPGTYLGRHAEACAEVGVTPDVARWQAGRERGLALYCTPETAYDVGRSGRRLNPICADDPALEAANRRGRAYHEIDQRIAALDDERRALSARIASLRDGKLGRDERAIIRAWRSDLRWNALRRDQLALEQLRYAFGP